MRDEANRRGIVEASDPGTAWTGWLDPLPRADLGPDDVVVTANERRGAESTPIGTTFAPPHRAARLRTLLDGRTELVAADFAALHGDTLLPTLDAVQALVSGSEDDGPVGRAILAWDGRMDADSAGAAAYAAWRAALVRRIAAEPVLAPLADPVVDDPVLRPWLDLTARVGSALEGLVAAGTPFGIDVPALAAQALRDAEGHAATWGETHVLAPVHAFDLVGDHDAPPVPPVPVAGDIDCVRCTGSLPGIDDRAWRGSVARYVWDLADPAGGGWVVPLGAAADPASPHRTDQLALWLEARLAPIELDWARLTEEAP